MAASCGKQPIRIGQRAGGYHPPPDLCGIISPLSLPPNPLLLREIKLYFSYCPDIGLI